MSSNIQDKDQTRYTQVNYTPSPNPKGLNQIDLDDLEKDLDGRKISVREFPVGMAQNETKQLNYSNDIEMMSQDNHESSNKIQKSTKQNISKRNKVKAPSS